MRLGYSLLLREYLAATEADYGDCAEFQITCPACHEAIFKAGALDGERQYFSHYAASKSDVSACELRVAAIHREQIERANLLGHDQTLAEFFARFQDALSDWIFGGFRDVDLPGLRRRLRWCSARRAFLQFADHLRGTDFPEQMREAVYGDLWNDVLKEFTDQSPLWIRRQRRFATDFLHHLDAPNSLSAWAFIIAIIVFMRTRGSASNILMAGRDAALKKLFTTLDHDLYTELVGITLRSTRILLILVPYADILRGTRRDWNRHRTLLLTMFRGYWDSEQEPVRGPPPE
jgi:hypothetical protein